MIYIEDSGLESYYKTLAFYKSLKPTYITSGHVLKISEEQVEEIAQYLYNVKEGIEIIFKDGNKQRVHQVNLETLETLETLIKDKREAL